jgi:hypothetical protein
MKGMILAGGSGTRPRSSMVLHEVLEARFGVRLGSWETAPDVVLEELRDLRRRKGPRGWQVLARDVEGIFWDSPNSLFCRVLRCSSVDLPKCCGAGLQRRHGVSPSFDLARGTDGE